jgi:uncharacterized protein (DUF433 family)
MATETLPQIKTTGPQHPYIERKPGVVGGEPVITGTRIAVRVIAVWHRMGNSVDEIVAMYPHINHAQVYDALSYYYDHKPEIEQFIAENDEDAVRQKYEAQQ